MSKIQDTGKYRTNINDQFYTNPIIAKQCIAKIIELFPVTYNYLWVEPSAGNGSFLNNIPPEYKKIGIDLEPMSSNIIKQDYIQWNPTLEINTNIIVFGNPPFGRQSSLAKSFIQKSCKFADIIAFILPKSFTKPSMYNAFGLNFHLMHSDELPKNSFIINNSPYDVPCVFQIWQKQEMPRNVENKIEPRGFKYVKSNENYHIAFRRVGGLAGKCYPNNGTKYSEQSHYFILFETKVKKISTIMEKINEHIFPSNTVGPRSLSKSEANSVINEIILAV